MVVPVLMYHSVRPASADYLTVSTARFREHLACLCSHHTPVSLAVAVDALLTGRSLPGDAVVVTFDDSLADSVEHALPILEAERVPAAFFVITDYLGKDNLWDHKAFSVAMHMTEEDVRDLARRGHDVGSHSATHQRLSKLPADRVEDEMVRSRDRLAGLIGRATLAFSYPYGDGDARSVALCRRHYALGLSTVRAGVFDWREEPGLVRRIYVAPDDTAPDLERKIGCYRAKVQHD